MSLVSDNIKDLLETETPLRFGIDLFIGKEPETPNNVVTLFDTPDKGRLLFYNRKDINGDYNRYEYAGCQVRIRNIEYDVAIEKAESIVDVLHNRGNEKVGNTTITLIEALDNPFIFDWDENNRVRVVVNFSIQRIP